MQAYVVTGEGLHRYYRRWRFNNSKQCDQLVLAKEELPNGCWMVYDTNNEGRPTFVKVVNPSETKTFAWASFHYFGPEDENRDCRIETSDGRVLEYRFEKEKLEVVAPISIVFIFEKSKGACPSNKPMFLLLLLPIFMRFCKKFCMPLLCKLASAIIIRAPKAP